MEEQLSAKLKHELESLQRDAKRIDRIESRIGIKRAQKARHRIVYRAMEWEDDYNVERDAVRVCLDKEKYRLLKTFRDECLIPRFEDDFYDYGYIDDLKEFEREIKGMGEIFWSVGLAKQVKGIAWLPREKLSSIVADRVSASPLAFNLEAEEGVHRLNVAVIRAYLEVADVAAFVKDVTLAVGLKITRKDGRWRPNLALERVLISASVKGSFASASLKGILAPELHVVQ
jgi:hypothetical protein